MLLIVFFIMCLARVCYLLVSHLVWSFVDMLIQNVPVLAVSFTMLNVCMSIYCVHLSFVLLCASVSFTMLNISHVILINWYVSLTYICLLDIFNLCCFIPVVLVYPLLDLFICVVDLSNIRFNCFKLICVVAFLSLLLTKYWFVLHMHCTMLLWPLLIVHRWLLHPQRRKHLQRKQIKEWKCTLTCSSMFPTLRDTKTSS